MDSDAYKTASVGSRVSRLESVSSPNEELILVDSSDRPLGYATKGQAHKDKGMLHRAFSIFLFDEQGRVLLHQRSSQKPLWPGFWTNSCCSHPRRGETLLGAAERRLYEELGVHGSVHPVYRFEYHASFHSQGSEHELCHVLLSRTHSASCVSVHPDEIQAVRWCTPEEIDDLVSSENDRLTPWFLMEWRELRDTYRETFDAFLAGAAGDVAA
ncbi:MAG: isopentenyl-diphosphate Delta-isomerase [Pseudomonadota bacterium]